MRSDATAGYSSPSDPPKTSFPRKRESILSRAGPPAPRGWGLTLAAAATLAFLHIPFLVILLYCFTTDDASYTFPPPGLTLEWFGAAWQRQDLWRALALSLRVGLTATAVALVLGTLAALVPEQLALEQRFR